MAKSILQDDKSCYLCGSQNWLEEHHVFEGSANRKISEREGFKVYLCHYCHNEPPMGVHFNSKRSNFLKRMCQTEYERTHTRADFMRIIGRNYMED